MSPSCSRVFSFVVPKNVVATTPVARQTTTTTTTTKRSYSSALSVVAVDRKQRKRNAIFEANASRDSSSSCFTASYLCAARMDAHARDDECGWEKHFKIRFLPFFLAADEREKGDTFSLVYMACMDLLEKSSQRILLSLLASARRTTFRGRERR